MTSVLPRFLCRRTSTSMRRPLACAPGRTSPPPRVLAAPTGPRDIGESDSFFVYDAINDENYTVTAVLEHVSDNAYWYVNPDLALPIDDLIEAAEVFEDRVRHEITNALGDIPSPGGGR